MTLVKVPGSGVGCRFAGWGAGLGAGCWVLSAGGGLGVGRRVLLAGAGCWVLMAGAEALAGAQWRVRIPGAGCCQKVLDRTMRLVKDFDYLCSPSSEGVSAP